MAKEPAISYGAGGWVGASAPGRAGIIGNPSDIYGGTVVSATIDARNSCRVRKSDSNIWPSEDRLILAAVKELGISDPFQLEWASEIPFSSGLSGSTAALASVLLALATLFKCPQDWQGIANRAQMAERIRKTERHQAGIMCGFQDVQMIVHGGMNAMDFPGRLPDNDHLEARFEAVSVTPITTYLEFLLITTGVERVSGSVHEPLAQRWLRGEVLVIETMERLGNLGRVGKELLMKSDQFGLGDAMLENHRLVQDLGATGREVDQLVQDCIQEGAQGAKLAGAGHGGTIIALCDSSDELETRLRRLGYTRFLRLILQEGLRLEIAELTRHKKMQPL